MPYRTALIRYGGANSVRGLVLLLGCGLLQLTLSAGVIEGLGQLVVRKLQRLDLGLRLLELLAELLVGDALLLRQCITGGYDGSIDGGAGVFAVI